jgi:hypothetical protein
LFAIEYENAVEFDSRVVDAGHRCSKGFSGYRPRVWSVVGFQKTNEQFFDP